MPRINHGHPLHGKRITVTSGQWRATCYAGLGGQSVEAFVPPFGWLIDANDEIPKHVFRRLIAKWFRNLRALLRHA